MIDRGPLQTIFTGLIERRVLPVAGAWLGVEILSFLFDAFLAPALFNLRGQSPFP